MVFCRHCGRSFPSEDITYCPFCGKPQKDVSRFASPQPTPPASNKSPGKTLAIALLAGAIAFQGIGHLYVGKTKKGIALLVVGWILGGLAILFFPLAIVSFVFWVWQSYDAYKKAKHYNEYLARNGKGPW